MTWLKDTGLRSKCSLLLRPVAGCLIIAACLLLGWALIPLLLGHGSLLVSFERLAAVTALLSGLAPGAVASRLRQPWLLAPLAASIALALGLAGISLLGWQPGLSLGLIVCTLGNLLLAVGMMRRLQQLDRARNAEPDLDQMHTLLERLVAERTAELEAANAALRESQLFFQRIVASVPLIMYVVDLIDLQQDYVNQDLLELLGYPPGQAVPPCAPMLQLVHWDDINALREHWARVAHATDGYVGMIEYRMRHADGSWRWLHARETIFSRNSDGTPRQILGVIEDVTSRKQIQVALAHQNRLLRQLSEKPASYEQVIMSRERLAVLHEVSQGFSTALLDPDQIYEVIHQAAAALMPVDALVITLVDEHRQLCTDVYHVDQLSHRSGASYPLAGSLIEHLMHSAASLRFDGGGPSSASGGQTSGALHSGLAVLLRVRSGVLGALCIYSLAAEAYTEEDQDLLELLATHAATALERVRLFAEVRRLATTDDLTGLANRRHFFDLAHNEIARAQRTSSPLAVVMLDIDSFKRINDSYGHMVGDRVLRHVADVCRSCVRTYDILGRYGGEELVLLLPATGAEGARQLAERLRMAVQQDLVTIELSTIHVTVSIGIAADNGANANLALLLQQADEALYRAKAKGKNQVVVWSPSCTDPAGPQLLSATG